MKIKHLETLSKSDYFHDGTLPCAVRVMKSAPSNDMIAMHDHEFSELVLVAAGSLKHIHKRRTDSLAAGDFLIVHPGMRHGYAELAKDTVVYNLVFTNALREYARLMSNNPLMKWIFPAEQAKSCAEVLGTMDATLTERAVRLLEEIRAEEKSKSGSSPAFCGALFAAVSSLLARGLGTSPSYRREYGHLQAELAYLNDRLGEKITIGNLCAVSGKSPSTLNRLFLAVFGKSPIDYLIERRLDQAEILCETTDDKLASIAIRCGFADASHLLRTFRRHNRRPPRQ